MSDGCSCRRPRPAWSAGVVVEHVPFKPGEESEPYTGTRLPHGWGPEPGACVWPDPARTLGFPSGGPASQEPARRDCPVWAGDGMAPSLINRSWKLIFPPPLTRVS